MTRIFSESNPDAELILGRFETALFFLCFSFFLLSCFFVCEVEAEQR